MTQFDDRERSYEAKFSRDQEHDFRAKSRRNRLLGMWAAEQLGHTDDEAKAYALEVMDSDFQRPGDDDVIEKVLGDLTAHGIEASEHLVRKKMDEFYSQALSDIDAG